MSGKHPIDNPEVIAEAVERRLRLLGFSNLQCIGQDFDYQREVGIQVWILSSNGERLLSNSYRMARWIEVEPAVYGPPELEEVAPGDLEHYDDDPEDDWFFRDLVRYRGRTYRVVAPCLKAAKTEKQEIYPDDIAEMLADWLTLIRKAGEALAA